MVAINYYRNNTTARHRDPTTDTCGCAQFSKLFFLKTPFGSRFTRQLPFSGLRGTIILCVDVYVCVCVCVCVCVSLGVSGCGCVSSFLNFFYFHIALSRKLLS